MRAIGTGLATLVAAASAVAPALVGVVLTGKGIAAVFMMFAAASAVGFFVSMRMVETSNRALEEISP